MVPSKAPKDVLGLGIHLVRELGLADSNDTLGRWICTYFLSGLDIPHVKGPLGIFQRTKSEKDDTRKLVHTINRALGDDVVPDSSVDAIFEKMWPDFEVHLQGMPKAEEMPKLRSTDEILSELLEFARASANRGKQSEWLDQLATENKDLLPALFGLLKSVNFDQLLSAPAPPAPPPPPREPLAVFCIRLAGDPELKRIQGTVTAMTAMGQIVVLIGNEVVAKFESVESWWRETPGSTSPKTITGTLGVSGK
jgi:hypothetical protein